jgi:hypothetical protein
MTAGNTAICGIVGGHRPPLQILEVGCTASLRYIFRAMMYCPRCKNTHWVQTKPRHFADRMAVLRLKRPYKCIKCDRIQLGSIFLDFKWPKPSKPKRKTPRGKTSKPELKCPECGETVRRSHRRGIERLFFFTKAYRCKKCETRFHKFTFQ